MPWLPCWQAEIAGGAYSSSALNTL
jgi:hypothetical protein